MTCPTFNSGSTETCVKPVVNPFRSLPPQHTTVLAHTGFDVFAIVSVAVLLIIVGIGVLIASRS
jgi:hypothetical protein